MKNSNKNKTKTFGKMFAISLALVAIGLTLTMADLFSSLITVGGFTFTGNDINISNYKIYAVCTNNSETKVQANENANICKMQGGAGFVYIYESKFYTIASMYENESDANNVLKNIKQTHQNACIITITIPAISIASNLSGEEKTTLESALNIFKNTYKKLYDVSVSLDTALITEVNARLSVNSIGSEITSVSSNFTTLFNTQMTNSFLIIKLKLSELSDCLDSLINTSPSIPYTSQIKNTYCKTIEIYKNLGSSLNNS